MAVEAVKTKAVMENLQTRLERAADESVSRVRPEVKLSEAVGRIWHLLLQSAQLSISQSREAKKP